MSTPTKEELEKENEKLKAELAKAKATPSLVADPTAVDLADYKDGTFKNSSGEEYQLKIVEDAEDGRTHKLKNKVHFWEGTKDQFKAEFEKK